MPRYVAFLRAINVGGHIVKMDRLRSLCEEAGLADVSTFIASGNVLFASKKSPAALEALVEKTLKAALGYEVETMVRTGTELEAILSRADGVDGWAASGATLYIGLLKSAPTAAAAAKVAGLSNSIDRLAVHGRELYWRCDKSFSESTVTGPALAKALGAVALTTRNVNTIRKIAAKLPPD